MDIEPTFVENALGRVLVRLLTQAGLKPAHEDPQNGFHVFGAYDQEIGTAEILVPHNDQHDHPTLLAAVEILPNDYTISFDISPGGWARVLVSNQPIDHSAEIANGR